MSRVSNAGAALAVLLSLIVLIVVRRIYPGMMLLNISSDLAAVEGVREREYNLIYLASVALVVSIGVKVTGTLLVGALVIVPAATARIWSTNLRQYACTSALMGAFSSVIGIVVSRWSGFLPGPSVILVSAVFLRSRC